MTITTIYEAAIGGTIEDFKEFYSPGSQNLAVEGGSTLLSYVIAYNDPVNRAAIANFLLDEGADPTWQDHRDGLTYLHALFGWFANKPVPQGDLVLAARLLDGGADVNAVDNVSGTPLQELTRRAVTHSERYAGPIYDLLFSRDDLDLFVRNARGNSTYRLAWRERDILPQLWERVQRYVADHGLTVPEGEIGG